jgi:lysophospholipase L1-like esterase
MALMFIRVSVALILACSCAWAQTTQPATTQSLREYPTVPVPKSGPRAERFAQRHAENLARAKQGDVELLFLGDSITEGWRNAADVFEKHFGQWKTANFGIGGDHTQHVLWRVMNGELDGISPKVVVMLIGTNNTGTWQPPDLIADGVARIVTTIREKSPNSRVLLLAIFPREKGRPEQCAKVPLINQHLAKLQDGRNVRYLDLTEKFLDANGNIQAEIMPDALHLSAAGYQIWAEAMQPLLEEMMDGKSR